MNNTNYNAVYRNTGTTPRSMRRVEDYYPLSSFKSEYDDAKKFAVDFAVMSLVIGLFGLIGYAVWQLVAMQ